MGYSSEDDAARLLETVRSLARELRPGAHGVDTLQLDHDLERDFGLDSLARVELLARIEREWGVRLADSAMIEAESPHDLLDHLGRAAPAVARLRQTGPEQVAPVSGPPPDTASTLVELLDWHAARHGERVHITLYDETEHTQDIRYQDLQAEAHSVAAGLVGEGASPGDRVAMMLPTGRDFFAAFYGVLYAGCVPVPLYPPARPSQIEDHMRRIAGIVANAEAVVLVTDPRARALGHLLRAECPALRKVATVEELSRPGDGFRPVARDASDIAFLQYTSGSTGSPKGVMLTHANLLANLKAMATASGVTERDVFVSWLPLYHDMGLIGACMGSLYVGFRLVLMSPLAFLARPARWLWAIHAHRATVSAAPNFAYELCVNKLDDRDLEGLNLDSWRLAYNGAEPVSPDTIERFGTRFARYGFRAGAMTPVYGLAESSVGLAFPPLGRGPRVDRVERAVLSRSGIARPAPASDPLAQRIVACGQALPGHAIRIVDDGGRPVPERTQGRVQFRGPSATQGYYRNPEANSGLFDGEWLNSGDLGYLAEGELFLTGREKDLIIRGGHNLYPQELEEAVSRLDGVRRGGVAVFPATDPGSGTEKLVVLAEIRDDMPAVRERLPRDINRLAVDLLGVPVDDIVLAAPRTVLKTSSGKVRRAACRALYEAGTLSRTQRAPWRQWLNLALTGAASRAGRWLRVSLGAAWSAWAWLVFLAIVPPAWILIAGMPGQARRRRIARTCARVALGLTGLSPRTSGMQHLNDHPGPMIVVCNHASYLDALVLVAVLPPRFAYVAKQELQHNPFAAIPLRRLGSAFVERFDSVRGVEDTQALEARLRAGESLAFFPEGTFRHQPGLLPFRMGAFVLAARTASPVVPVCLTGSRTLLPGRELRPRFSRLKVAVNAPIISNDSEWKAALHLRDNARRQILLLSGEPDAAG